MRGPYSSQKYQCLQASQALGGHYLSAGFHPSLYTVLYTGKPAIQASKTSNWERSPLRGRSKRNPKPAHWNWNFCLSNVWNSAVASSSHSRFSESDDIISKAEKNLCPLGVGFQRFAAPLSTAQVFHAEKPQDFRTPILHPGGRGDVAEKAQISHSYMDCRSALGFWRMSLGLFLGILLALNRVRRIRINLACGSW